ncbi:hypothetical protein M0813_23192 [Anaeramoeba flamelloides]|uniref:BTB domain-containing protein n=1 Tax=Anaeramoeba flamelloides TaxID=1746091 RepID=A0ABQ8Y9B8_9EUKA|nr:hypothetical protein M0813_23192 [Anaeramoeba flamelloides]
MSQILIGSFVEKGILGSLTSNGIQNLSDLNCFKKLNIQSISSSNTFTLFLTLKGLVYFLSKEGTEPGILNFPEPIEKILCSKKCFVAISRKGNVYFWGEHHSKLPFTKKELYQNNSYCKPDLIHFNQSTTKVLQVGVYQNGILLLLNSNKLVLIPQWYCSIEETKNEQQKKNKPVFRNEKTDQNQSGSRESKKTKSVRAVTRKRRNGKKSLLVKKKDSATKRSSQKMNKNKFFLLGKDIIQFWSGYARHVFYKTIDGEYCSMGVARFGQRGANLGLGINFQKPTKMDNCKAFANPKFISLNYYSTLVVDQKGQLWSTGRAGANGGEKTRDFFCKVQLFKNTKILHISSGESYSMVVTDRLKAYAFGTNENFIWGDGSAPKFEIQIPFHKFDRIKAFQCNSQLSFWIKTERNTLAQDWSKMLSLQEKTDLQMGKLKIHKEFLLHRIGKNNLKVLSELKFEQQKKIINWCYSEQTYPPKEIDKIFPEKMKSLKETMLEMFKDEESKDFSINVKNKKILCHKIILQARSNLFRSMFVSVSENFFDVNEPTEKSLKTMKILIHWMYLDEIQKIEKKDFSQMINEIDEAIDFYQLNEDSILSDWVQEKSKEFN